eukprot:CAMPEP_0168487286 /NCGR_PEP_ID=MMETSP0228-20121227/67555_1 /TAXON_ID=133427 /ORGANISM="Protoceratium reticulatum, Strain CCCM 535 (=CCMP 1889)" /LENGTH=93 /DNA_ID=CAMNT_0008503893 /DNA_START=59 /DNA_END=337 /DNA_ORIENTATION=-
MTMERVAKFSSSVLDIMSSSNTRMRCHFLLREQASIDELQLTRFGSTPSGRMRRSSSSASGHRPPFSQALAAALRATTSASAPAERSSPKRTR